MVILQSNHKPQAATTTVSANRRHHHKKSSMMDDTVVSIPIGFGKGGNDLSVSRPGPASISTRRGAYDTHKNNTRSASQSVQSNRMKSSQLIREGRLEEAMVEVNNMLVKPKLVKYTERHRDPTPNTQAEAYYLRG